jgi:hypothetical protein
MSIKPRMPKWREQSHLDKTPMSSIQSPFPPVRRVVTGHSAAGKSTVLADNTQPARFWTPESVAPMYDLHYTAEAPAVIDSEITTGKWVDEIMQHPELVSGSGSTFRCWDFAPGDVSVRLLITYGEF